MVCFCILLFGLLLHMGKQALMRYEAKILLCHIVFPFGYRLSCFFFLCSFRFIMMLCLFFLYRFLEGFISVQFVSVLLLLPAGCCYVAVCSFLIYEEQQVQTRCWGYRELCGIMVFILFILSPFVCLAGTDL